MSKQKQVFEISWEVCNMVGGIYTVLSSKVPLAKKKLDSYWAVGPYMAKQEHLFLEEEIPHEYKIAYQKLLEQGIELHFGTWLIEGTPKTILVDSSKYHCHANEIKASLWERYGIDSLHSSWFDFDEVVVWAYACGIAIETLTAKEENPTIVHAHEWMAGGALLSLDGKDKYKKVFTTHATLLGRTLNANGIDPLSQLNPEEKAREFGVVTKFHMEKTLAKISEVFTTVSDTTAFEAQHLLGKKPDVLTYNGFELPEADFSKVTREFEHSRGIVNSFLEEYSHDFSALNVDNTQIIFTSGRNEFLNKGFDVFISALGKLNKELKEEQSSPEVLGLLLVPIGEFPLDGEVEVSRQNFLKKNNSLAKGNIHYSTHILEENNPYYQAFHQAELFNNPEDKVKIIVIPSYLKQGDGLFNKSYYNIIKGLDLGVFVSSYEPWGYTPMEAISYGVPTITSNVSGFGQYIESKHPNKKGVNILRKENSFEKQSLALSKEIKDFLDQSQKEKLRQKEEAFEFAQEFSWENFYQYYLEAYQKALD